MASAAAPTEAEWNALRAGAVVESRSREGRTIRSSLTAVMDATPTELLAIAGSPCEPTPEYDGPPPRALDPEKVLEVLATSPKDASAFDDVPTVPCVLTRGDRELFTLTKIPLPFPLSDTWLLIRLSLEHFSRDGWLLRMETLAGGLGDISGTIQAKRLDDGRLLHTADRTTTITLPIPTFLLDRHDDGAAQKSIDRIRERIRSMRKSARDW